MLHRCCSQAYSAGWQPIDINTADAKTLSAQVTGIGPAKAAAIVAFREKHGPFKSVDDLLLIQGIGESTLKKNRDRLTAASP
ncbi:MAG: helix-hairpin-helix domain-containing protein [Pseudomonadota bacterium]|nr:helix-hairpin-helix domain-containing protein [Pseudomonadota bacterium]